MFLLLLQGFLLLALQLFELYLHIVLLYMMRIVWLMSVVCDVSMRMCCCVN